MSTCPQVGCKLRKTSENQAVCLKNGCIFRLEKQQTVDQDNGILWFLLIALFVLIIVVDRG